MAKLFDKLAEKGSSEEDRLEILNLLDVIDKPSDPLYDELVQLASEFCETPIALITLVDESRQWFKSKIGLEVTETARDISFCTLAIKQDQPFIVKDALLDSRFSNNPLVTGAPHIRFYAGIPLAIGRLRIGTLCVIDSKPRMLSDKQIRTLTVLAKQVIVNMEMKHRESLRKDSELKVISSAKMSALGEMASGIAHEINNPLAVIMSRAGQLLEIAGENPIEAERIKKAAQFIEKTCSRISKTVRALRTFARDDENEALEASLVEDLFSDTLAICSQRFGSGVKLEVSNSTGLLKVACHPVQISNVIMNLLSNAYDAALESSAKWVQLTAAVLNDHIEISVLDSGPGVPESLRKHIMDPFFTTKPVGKGTGIGLSISQRILHAHGSDLQFDFNSPNTRIFFKLPIVD